MKLDKSLKNLQNLIDINTEQLIILDSIITSSSQTIDSLENRLKRSEMNNEELEQVLKKQRKSFSQLETNLQITDKLSLYGALLLMFGLFIEIVGAVLLSGSDLSREIKPILDIQLPLNYHEFGSADKTKDNVMRFYASVGAFLLVLGFIFQFIGTGLVVKLNIWIFVVFIVFTGTIALLLMSSLIRKGSEQKFANKLSILFSNSFRIILHPLKMKFCPKSHIVCDICSEYVPTNTASVGFIQDIDPKNSEAFHAPYDFAIGHLDCINNNIPTIHRTATIGLERYRRTFTLQEFYNEQYPELKIKNDIRLEKNNIEMEETRYSLQRLYNIIKER
ncbi:hypothetical protein E9993_17025 [Labilibacter sediminis]|nr:hypothetical protein E9993_17025 [Labilibacter sediminis]